MLAYRVQKPCSTKIGVCPAGNGIWGASYDHAGNLLTLRHSAGSVSFRRTMELDANSNRLACIRGGSVPIPMYYDSGGNLSEQSASRKFEWGYGDRLRAFFVQVTAGNAGSLSLFTHYLYDSAGNRVKKLIRNQQGQIFATTYIGTFFEHHREQGAENETLHVMDGTRRLATIRVGTPFPDDSTPAVKFVHADHLGSCVLMTDPAGQLVNREEYTPWGDTSYGSFLRKRYRFSGKERDSDTGLCYYGARYYAPGLARWVSCDPAGGTNLYSAFLNNPICFTDPIGENVMPGPSDTAAQAPTAAGGAGAAKVPTSSSSLLDQVARDPCLKYGCFSEPNPIELEVDWYLDRELEYHEMLRMLDKPVGSELEIPQGEIVEELAAYRAEVRAYILATHYDAVTSATLPGSPGGGNPLQQVPAEEATAPAGSSTVALIPRPDPSMASRASPGAGEGWWSRFTRSSMARTASLLFSLWAPKNVDNPDPGHIKPDSGFIKEEAKREERREQAQRIRPPTVSGPPPPPPQRLRFRLNLLRDRQEFLKEEERLREDVKRF